MYSLVDVDPKKEYGVARLPEWKAVQDGLKRNLVAFLLHHRHASYSVASDHILVQLLQSLNVPHSLNDSRYLSNVLSVGLQTANALRFVTPFGSGKLFQGVFFNSFIREVIIAYDEPFNITKVIDHWEDATPVRFLRHPYSQLGLHVPNGKVGGTQEGLAIIGVNVSLLAVQYRAFCEQERLYQLANPEHALRNVMQFVHMFVLPNMLESYLDYALFNRIDELSQGVHAPRAPGRKEAIYMASFENQVVSLYSRILDLLRASSYTAPMTLAAIPVAAAPDLRTVMFVPDVAPTRPILWSVILARLPLLLFLVRTTQVNGKLPNQAGLLDVRVTLTRLKSQKVLDSTLPKELHQSTMATIDEILGAL